MRGPRLVQANRGSPPWGYLYGTADLGQAVGGGWARRGEAFSGVSLHLRLEPPHLPPESPDLPEDECRPQSSCGKPEDQDHRYHVEPSYFQLLSLQRYTEQARPAWSAET